MRQRLIESATQEIMGHGYAAASVDSICARAGASKGSFYHFFGSKSEIGASVLELWFERVRTAAEGGPYQTEADSRKRLLGYVNHVKNISPGLWGRGSALAAVVTELGESGQPLPEACQRLLADAAGGWAPLFQPAAQRLDGARTARDLAQLFMAVIEGAALLARAQGRPEASREIIDTFQLCLRKLLEYSRESA